MMVSGHGRLTPSPRFAGLGLIVLALAGSVAAGFLFPHPAWSLAAAALLTASLIGMCIGLLWLFRPSWADKTWPPGGHRRPNANRGLKVMRIIGLVQLSLVPLVIAAWIFFSITGEADVEDGIRYGFFIGLYLLQGSTLLVAARQQATTK